MLRNIGLVEYTGSRPASGGRPGFRYYDDLSIVSDAQLRGGFIVSGDGYIDIVRDHPDYRWTICERKLKPWWQYMDGKVVNSGRDRFVHSKPSIMRR